MVIVLALLFALVQTGRPPIPATDVAAADILATQKTAIEKKIVDIPIRTVDGGGHHIGIGLVHRPKGTNIPGGSLHDQVSEVYHVLEGSGTLVTGGTLVNPTRRDSAAEVVTQINGPGVSGTAIEGGVRRRVSKGDVVIIPAGTPHWFPEVHESITYTVVRIDPNRVVMGVVYRNLKREAEAEAAYQQALKHLDRMTEREKYRTLGGYYFIAGNYEKAIENYETLVRLFPADTAGHANLALAYLLVHDLARAVEEGRKAIEIYPRNPGQRTNYAMYSMYAGDFDTAIAECHRALEQSPSYEFALQTLALASAAKGDIAAARDAYAKLERASPLGASMANIGRADLALSLGRFREAVGILEAGIAADRKAEHGGDAVAKLVVLARAYFEAGHFAEALAEFDTCVTRKGETTDVFFTDTPSLRYMPQAYYWLARAQEGVGADAARKSYQAFLAWRGDADPADALAADARRRLTHQAPSPGS
jgi:tetratricopeptide (TPR) repeat protein